ncbi:hypothetical protein CAPTEDRAFT_190460 [Capitella teleta]|uniref:Transposable element P transposase-like RNase H domain-containing protein n=1 Tax=Capitella teleta TaxID=283909 RepID=R7T3Z2_CAPTE|nr:hypothetical protein CAPTEDRAFT_190460 [Capitella teleta]|eukprot:ELT87513.1 hypothetical protein CAPTEDRAFT_190460 [Capitella teleta]
MALEVIHAVVHRESYQIIHFTEESEVATECSVLYNLYRSPFLRQSFTRSTLTLERPQKKRKKALKLIHRAGPPANTISIPNPFKLTTPFWPAEGNSTINGQAVAKDGVVTCSLWDREVSLGNLHISCKYGNDEELNEQPAAQAFSGQPAKNIIEQPPGLNRKHLWWMRAEADEHGLKPDERVGGLIFDEMSIQEDIHVSHRGIKSYYTGLVQHNEEGDALVQLRKGKSEVQLASHVLQILFVSHSGFRFPVAHYPTHEAQAPELFHVIWEAIDKLDDWGFNVEYLCQDGAVANRQLVQIFCAGKLPRDVNFTAPSMLNPTQNMVFIMDPKHTHKKIRNGLLSSGSIRQLTLPHLGENSTVLWEHWRAAYQWDTENNPLPIHRKLTPAHMQPDSSEKMRNHLAEEVLDKDMLLLMKEYRTSLGDHGEHLNASISLLEATAVVVDFFDSDHPVVGPDDSRFASALFVMELTTTPTTININMP